MFGFNENQFDCLPFLNKPLGSSHYHLLKKDPKFHGSQLWVHLMSFHYFISCFNWYLRPNHRMLKSANFGMKYLKYILIILKMFYLELIYPSFRLLCICCCLLLQLAVSVELSKVWYCVSAYLENFGIHIRFRYESVREGWMINLTPLGKLGIKLTYLKT